MRNGNGKHSAGPTLSPKLARCAIYTRKSTEEGLEQDFNSLDAQREAAQAFILSQRQEGWQALPDRFDDGGYTGANLERPALQRLLAAVQARQVDCVVVYKVDRLSRSLLDFARLMELFDRQGVSFVSVTQQFNTTNSLGRLTLNILLSFAQFERELISERTRDKLSAARRKGKWIGGHPVLGYDIDPRGGRLIINPEEARQVRKIFQWYLERQALLPVLRELDHRHWRTKRWTTREGVSRGGRPFTKSSLHGLLTNAIYTGQVNHKGTLFPGEHQAILEPATWERVQDILDRNGRTHGGGAKNQYGALLRGLLFCVPCGSAMVHTYSAKGNKRYRYYVCYQAQQRGWQSCQTKSVSAPAIEAAVLESLRKLGAHPKLAQQTARQAREQMAAQREDLEQEQASARKRLRDLQADLVRVAAENSVARFDRLLELERETQAAEQRLAALAAELREWQDDAVDEADLGRALTEFDPVWEALTTPEQVQLVRLLVEKVGYDGRSGKVTVSFRSAGLKELCNGSIDAKRPVS